MTTRLRPSRIRGGGTAAALLRARDWSATELGPLEVWPRALRFALRLALRSPGPAAALGGPRLRVFYNDAWARLEGERHPRAFGARAEDAGGLWEILYPAARRAADGDEAVTIDDVPCAGRRFSFAFTPLSSEPDDVEGLFCAATDQTRRTSAERTLKLLRELSDAGSDARAAGLLAAELGFAWIYRVESDGDTLRLSGAAGAEAPAELRLSRLPALRPGTTALALVAPGERRPSGLLITGAADWLEPAARLLAGPRDAESLAYTLAHDLRAPLRAMTSFSEALLEDHGSALDEDGRALARRIAGAGRRADAMINDLLAYSRLGRERVEAEETDLEALTAEALADLEETLRARGASVEVQGPLPRIRAHGPSLRRALENLISNAVKFTAPGVPPRVRIRWEGRRLWVEDNGIGIAREDQERIFGLFERLHRPDAYPGTGVGLAITRRAMERMGGTVGVESEPGRGSRFYLEFPSGDRA